MKEKRLLLSRELVIVKTDIKLHICNNKDLIIRCTSKLTEKPNIKQQYNQLYNTESSQNIEYPNKTKVSIRGNQHREVNGIDRNFNYQQF